MKYLNSMCLPEDLDYINYQRCITVIPTVILKKFCVPCLSKLGLWKSSSSKVEDDVPSYRTRCHQRVFDTRYCPKHKIQIKKKEAKLSMAIIVIITIVFLTIMMIITSPLFIISLFVLLFLLTLFFD